MLYSMDSGTSVIARVYVVLFGVSYFLFLRTCRHSVYFSNSLFQDNSLILSVKWYLECVMEHFLDIFGFDA